MAEQEEMFETDEVVAAEDSTDSIFETKSSVISFVEDRYKRSEDSRYADEERWLKAYRNYRGLYSKDVQFTDTEKSRVFVKVTKTKTLAAYGQIVDVLFGNNKFPLSVNPSVLPDGVAESLHINVDPMAFEMALLGTGVMKGPFAVDKEYPNWNEEGEYDPLVKTVPECSHVSVWDFYPDPEAKSMNDAEYVVQRHKMSRTQLRALKGRPYFMDDSIGMAVDKGPNYVQKYWEMSMEDDDTQPSSERWEVLEFWGFVDTDVLEEHGVSIPKALKEFDEVNCNVWICNGEVLRFVLNPFKPTRIPYYAVPYEHNPYSFFGVGIAENMDDTQTLMNGFMRMAIDNAALSGNLIIEVGFPSFAHGQTGVSGVGRTASGISMLMSAANGSIRTVVKNVDDYLIRPLGKSFFAFNMQFDFDESIRGDLEVHASGTESLMANEVRSQRLMQFLQVAQNPVLAPFAKMDYIIREIAKSMDLDPDKVTNSMQDAAIQAEILKGFQQPAQPPMGPEGVPAPEGQEQAPQSPQGGVQDTSGGGGGQIGMGTAPTPGEQGFSGNVA